MMGVRQGKVLVLSALLVSQLFVVQALAVDADDDGMEDSWEQTYGLDPTDPSDAALDSDSDTLSNAEEYALLTNPNLRDTDNDWIPDGYEVNVAGTDPTLVDTDGDGIGDFWEAFHGFDPLDSADVYVDSDGDSLVDFAEIVYYKTDPNNTDSDGDFLTDDREIRDFGFNPNIADSDGDGTSDWGEIFIDEDGDGLALWQEVDAGTDPLLIDSDGDVMTDGWELDAGLDPLSSADAGSDNDGDGFTAIQEYRLGSDPDVGASVPAYLELDYSESFEGGVVPPAWYTQAASGILPWAADCAWSAVDGSCALVSGEGQKSSISFMARFQQGDFTLHYAGWSPQNDLTVLVDGVEVFSFSGSAFAWPQISVPLTDGVHEITIEHDGAVSPQGTFGIDGIAFATSGLSVRPSNDSCIAPPVTGTSSSVSVEYPFPEIYTFEQVTKILQPPGDPSRWFVLEQTGKIKVFDVDDPADVRVYLDFSGDLRSTAEAGLLGMDFDPNFPAVPEVYVFYVDADNNSTISRIILDDTDAPVSPVEQKILTLDKISAYHYGGELRFGPDGMLYTAVGEDLRVYRAKDTTNLFGSMLRIDVRGVGWPIPAYEIPPGNAFPSSNPKCGPTETNSDHCPEIIAWGFRNPWRFSIDSATGDIWSGDVGNNEREEINKIEVGGNYGWPCYEGTLPGPLLNECIAEGQVTLEPTIEYTHEEGRAVTAGAVYRGSGIPSLQGRYVFGDLGRSIWEALPDGNGGFVRNKIATAPWTTAVISEGADGEIYFASYFNELWYPDRTPPPVIGKLVVGPGGTPEDPIEDLLSDTGCVDPTNPAEPSSVTIPYDINALFWSDNAEKTRFMAIPDGTTITINSDDDWSYPVGSVLVKNFRLAGKLIETRLLMNRLDPALGQGQWEGFSYEWNDDETEATRVVGGKVKNIAGQDWTYPSGEQCDACHTGAAGSVLGPETAQLNMEYHYPGSTGPVNQLEELDEIGMFSSPLAGTPETLPALADPFDESAPLYERARAYLHTNCAQCHRPGTGVQAPMDFRYSNSLADTTMCDIVPQHGDLGIGAGARLIAPGNAASSVIISRIGRRDAFGMPPLGSTVPDSAGVQLLTDWVNSMESCQEP